MSSQYFTALQFTLSVTAPVFLIVFLGLFLKRGGHINDEFIGVASKLVFNVCLPVLIFLAIVESQVSLIDQWKLALFSAMAAIVSFFIFWWLYPLTGQAPKERGVAVQSAFRSNLGIVGIALCAKAFDESGLAVAALLIAVVTPLYNVLSIYGLTHSLKEGGKIDWRQLLIGIVRNPLIISITLAFVFLAVDITLPEILNDTGRYLGGMTLPLALITIGGSMSMTALRQSSSLSALVVAVKLIVLPALVVGPAWLLGFRGVELGCLLLMFASPTATVCFVMARALGGNHQLASNTIVLSTLCGCLTISLFLYMIRVSGLV